MWRFALVPVFLAVLCASSQAWTAKTYQVIVVKSVKLMPRSFQNIMLRHKEEILGGCLRPDNEEESAHAYDLANRSGWLQDRILALSQSIPDKMNRHVPFKEIAQDFGSLSHYVTDLNDPLIIGNSDPREPEYRQDFYIYAEKNMELFPWIFDGHEDPVLQSGDEKQYLYNVAARAAEKYDRIGEAYFPDGTLVSSDTFDPKSLPFGVASLAYSRSITDTVQLWFYVWRKAHGDVSITPFFSKQKQGVSHEN